MNTLVWETFVDIISTNTYEYIVPTQNSITYQTFNSCDVAYSLEDLDYGGTTVLSHKNRHH